MHTKAEAEFFNVCVCACATGLLQMQLILHYDMTYREVKYSNLGLVDIDRKMLMGINVTPIIGLLYTPILIRLMLTHTHTDIQTQMIKPFLLI